MEFEQLRHQVLNGVEHARGHASNIKYTSPMLSDALYDMAAEAERAAHETPHKDVLLVAIGKLHGANHAAFAYLRGLGG